MKKLILILVALIFIGCAKEKQKLKSEYTIKAKISRIECNTSYSNGVCLSYTLYAQTDKATYKLVAEDSMSLAVGDYIYLNMRSYDIFFE